MNFVGNFCQEKFILNYIIVEVSIVKSEGEKNLALIFARPSNFLPEVSVSPSAYSRSFLFLVPLIGKGKSGGRTTLWCGGHLPTEFLTPEE